MRVSGGRRIQSPCTFGIPILVLHVIWKLQFSPKWQAPIGQKWWDHGISHRCHRNVAFEVTVGDALTFQFPHKKHLFLRKMFTSLRKSLRISGGKRIWIPSQVISSPASFTRGLEIAIQSKKTGSRWSKVVGPTTNDNGNGTSHHWPYLISGLISY